MKILTDSLSLFNFFPSRYKRKIFYVLLFLAFSSLLELTATIAIIPFVSSILHDNSSDPPLFLSLFGFDGLDRNTLFFLSSTLLAFLSIFSSFVRSFSLHLTNKLVQNLAIYLGSSVYQSFVDLPYRFFREQGKQYMLSTCLNDVPLTVVSIRYLFQLYSAIFTALLISVLLLFSIGYFVLPTAIICLLFYSLYGIATKRRITSNSFLCQSSYQEQLELINDTSSLIPEMSVCGTTSQYISEYCRVESSVRMARAFDQTASTLPKFLAEGIGYASISLTCIIAFGYGGLNSGSLIQSLALLAVGIQRFLPALQSIFSSYATIKSCQASTSRTLSYFSSNTNLILAESSSSFGTPVLSSSFTSLQLHDLSFSHTSNNSSSLLSGINLTIRSGSMIAIVGKSGSGKTTLLELIMGLVEPSEGSIILNNHSLTLPRDNTYRNFFAYQQQNVYIMNKSLSENILFGESMRSHWFDQVLKIVNLDDFINTLGQGADSLLGVNGSKLSGGQRQRVALARTLYRRRPILVLDEPFSALDKSTSYSILSNLSSMVNRPTIIMVTHDRDALDLFDYVYEVSGRTVHSWSDSLK